MDTVVVNDFKHGFLRLHILAYIHINPVHITGYGTDNRHIFIEIALLYLFRVEM